MIFNDNDIVMKLYKYAKLLWDGNSQWLILKCFQNRIYPALKRQTFLIKSISWRANYKTTDFRIKQLFTIGIGMFIHMYIHGGMIFVNKMSQHKKPFELIATPFPQHPVDSSDL